MPLPAEDPPAGVPDWVLTYGDMMSLLLCFFILLAAFSEPKSDKKEVLVESLLRQFGDEEALSMFIASHQMNRTVNKVGSTVDPRNAASENRRKAAAGAVGAPGKRSRVETIRDGKRQVVGGPALFEPGQATLNADAKEALQNIADQLRGKRHLIDVRGYEPVGKLPPSSPYADPFDLAYARTRAVVDFLAQQGQLHRELIRISIAAPIETVTLPNTSTGDPMHERVTITTVEATGAEFERAAAPTTKAAAPATK